MPKTILCIDNDPGIVIAYRSVLEESGYRVLIAFDGHYGLEQLDHHAVDVVLLDYEMPGMDGEAVVVEITRRQLHIPIILVSGSDQIPKSLLSQVLMFVEKPVRTDDLLFSVEAAASAVRSTDESRATQSRR